MAKPEHNAVEAWVVDLCPHEHGEGKIVGLVRSVWRDRVQFNQCGVTEFSSISAGQTNEPYFSLLTTFDTEKYETSCLLTEHHRLIPNLGALLGEAGC
jgi:hypothetical protein